MKNQQQTSALKYKRDYFNPEDSGIGALAGILAPQVVLFVFAIILTLIAGGDDAYYKYLTQEDILVTYFTLAFGELAFFFAYIILVKQRKVDPLTSAGLKKGINLKTVPIIICLAVAMILFFSPVVNLIDYLISLTGYSIDTEIGIPLNNFGQYALAVLLVAVLPAFCEEIIFRGVVLNGLRKFGMWPAILISSLFFMLMHGNIQQTVYTLFLGIMLGYVVYKTKSLWAGIIVHFINNLITITWLYFANLGWVESSSTLTIDGPYIAYALVALAIGIGLVILAFYLIKRFNKESNETNIAENTSDNTLPSPRPKLKELFKNSTVVVTMVMALIVSLAFWVYDFVSKI